VRLVRRMTVGVGLDSDNRAARDLREGDRLHLRSRVTGENRDLLVDEVVIVALLPSRLMSTTVAAAP
jgi:hypothetical protein